MVLSRSLAHRTGSALLVRRRESTFSACLGVMLSYCFLCYVFIIVKLAYFFKNVKNEEYAQEASFLPIFSPPLPSPSSQITLSRTYSPPAPNPLVWRRPEQFSLPTGRLHEIRLDDKESKDDNSMRILRKWSEDGL